MSDNILDRFEKSIDEEKIVDASKKLRVGIIGTGGIAKAHIKGYLEFPDVEIVAGADIVPGKAKEFFEEFGVKDAKCYESHTDMLNDESLKLDAVSICTYNCTHAECTIAALEKGIHVLLEKPMCVTVSEAVEMIKAEKKNGKILSIGFQPRFDPNMKMVKEVVESGELGDIYYIQTGGGRRRGIPTGVQTKSTFIEKETGGLGALGDIGCYSLDMVLNAIGYPKPLTVTGYTSDFFGKDPNYSGYNGHHYFAEKFGVDDFAAGFIRLEGGIILDFRISWAMNLDTPGDTIILGTKAGLRIPSTNCWNGSIGGPLVIYREVAGKQIQYEIPMIENHGINCFKEKLRSFLDAIKEGGTAPVPTSQIFYNQIILSGIADSAKIGKEIKVEIPEV